MAGNNSIQMLRGTRNSIANATTQQLLPGQPLYDSSDNYLFVGGGQSDEVTSISSLNPIACREMKGYVTDLSSGGMNSVTTDDKSQITTEQWSIRYEPGKGIRLNSPVQAEDSTSYTSMVDTSIQSFTFGGKDSEDADVDTTSNWSLNIGYGNKLLHNKYGSGVIGWHNEIKGEDCRGTLIFGGGNSIIHEDSSILGSKFNHILGHDNSIKDCIDVTLIGSNNTSSGTDINNGGCAIGNSNIIDNQHQYLIGHHLTGTRTAQVVVGRYNKVDGLDSLERNCFFAVGTGTSDSNRLTPFWVSDTKAYVTTPVDSYSDSREIVNWGKAVSYGNSILNQCVKRVSTEESEGRVYCTFPSSSSSVLNMSSQGLGGAVTRYDSSGNLTVKKRLNIEGNAGIASFGFQDDGAFAITSGENSIVIGDSSISLFQESWTCDALLGGGTLMPFEKSIKGIGYYVIHSFNSWYDAGIDYSYNIHLRILTNIVGYQELPEVSKNGNFTEEFTNIINNQLAIVTLAEDATFTTKVSTESTSTWKSYYAIQMHIDLLQETVKFFSVDRNGNTLNYSIPILKFIDGMYYQSYQTNSLLG